MLDYSQACWHIYRKLLKGIVFTHKWNTIFKKGIIFYLIYVSVECIGQAAGLRFSTEAILHSSFHCAVEMCSDNVTSVLCSVQCKVCKGHLHCIRCTDCQDGSSNCKCTIAQPPPQLHCTALHCTT